MTLKTLANQSCADKVEWFCRMRDFICARNGTYDYSTTGIGWTLHDSSYATDEDNPAANDWFVIYSPGESGDDDLYFKVTFKAGDLLYQGYLYWDNSTHTGVHVYNTTDNINIADTGACILFVNGDLDSINCWETVNASYDYCVVFGMLDNLPVDNTVATSSAALSSGADVTITLDAVPATWEVNQKIYIRDNTSVGIITIKTISGNDITADLATSYDAGVKLQGDLGYFCNSSATTVAQYMMCGRVSSAISAANTVYTAVSGNANPDELTNMFVAVPFHLLSGDAYFGTIPRLFFTVSSGLTSGDTLTANSKNYRYLKYYSSIHTMIEEA